MSTWGRSNPEVPADWPSVELERVGVHSGGWRITLGILLVGLILVVAWFKPWVTVPTEVALVIPTPTASPPPTSAPTPTPTPETTATAEQPGPSPDPIMLAVQRRQCKSPTDWRMVTAEHTVTRDTRTMYAASPIHASGPTDPSLALSHLYADGLKAVGVCVPRTGDGSLLSILARVRLWQVTMDGSVRLIDAPAVTDEPLYEAGEAYFGPPATEGALWPAGRYIFEITSAVAGPSRWIGLEFLPTRSGSASQSR